MLSILFIVFAAIAAFIALVFFLMALANLTTKFPDEGKPTPVTHMAKSSRVTAYATLTIAALLMASTLYVLSTLIRY